MNDPVEPASGSSTDLGARSTDASAESRPAAAIVVRGRPTDAELAALTAVLLGRPAEEQPVVPRRPASRWASRSDLLRLTPAPGPGAWNAALRY